MQETRLDSTGDRQAGGLASTWRIAEAALRDGSATMNLTRIEGGPCLECADITPPPDSGRSSSSTYRDSWWRKIYCGYGDEVGRALLFERFSLDVTESEAAAQPEPLRMPDLTGDWLFFTEQAPGAEPHFKKSMSGQRCYADQISIQPHR